MVVQVEPKLWITSRKQHNMRHMRLPQDLDCTQGLWSRSCAIILNIPHIGRQPQVKYTRRLSPQYPSSDLARDPICRWWGKEEKTLLPLVSHCEYAVYRKYSRIRISGTAKNYKFAFYKTNNFSWNYSGIKHNLRNIIGLRPRR